MQVEGDTIASDRFTMQIIRGCDATEPIALLAFAIVVSPAGGGTKWLGVLAGTLALLGVNVIRLVSLFLIGTYAPSLFQPMHEEVWQGVLIVATIATWVAWLSWVRRSGRAIAC